MIPIGSVRKSQFLLGMVIRRKRNNLDNRGERSPIPKNDTNKSKMAYPKMR
jgi:hypothetical protein